MPSGSPDNMGTQKDMLGEDVHPNQKKDIGSKIAPYRLIGRRSSGSGGKG